ncbi:UTP--glucose-1-phosphate uridylyltransferase [compost metagenome]
MILDQYTADQHIENLAAMLVCYQLTGRSQVMVEPVPLSDTDKYGIADCNQIALQPGQSAPIVGLVEKPDVDAAPSNLAVVGRYVLSNNIWPLLKKTAPGAGDEIQLTDAIAMLIEQETVDAFHMTGQSHDCGNKLGYMKANITYAMRHHEIGPSVIDYLENLTSTSHKKASV